MKKGKFMDSNIKTLSVAETRSYKDFAPPPPENASVARVLSVLTL